MAFFSGSSFYQADISDGWGSLWIEEAEKEGEHGVYSC
jgi:hypothetical protein